MKGICELNIDELDTVVGGTPVTVGGRSWELCDNGTPEGGGAGLYPPGTACATQTVAQVVGAFVAGFNKYAPGGGGGGGSGSGSGSGGYPA